MEQRAYDSRQYRAALAEIKATGPTCVICGHPGSDSIHHPLSQSGYPELAGDPANWAPAHGVAGCPWCPPNPSRDRRRRGQPTRCNQAQGARLTPKPTPTARRW